MNEPLSQRTEAWFAERGWTVFDFQRLAWQGWHEGRSGLIHSPTGSGKTLAAFLGPVQALAAGQGPARGDGIEVLWITPLRALANDTRTHLQTALDAHDCRVRVELRTGDSSSAQRKRLLSEPPYGLVTTPESLSVMLADGALRRHFKSVHTVIVDEWHELLGSKRGVLLQLSLAHLRWHLPRLRIWGLSATLGNLDTALRVLLGPRQQGVLIRGVVPREVRIQALLPEQGERFRWSGHLGLQLLNRVIERIESCSSTLLFTNTRSQAELWYQALLGKRPDWLESLALHHGSLDRALREDIELRLADGRLLCVVCTSSLDLGVDFTPVDQVLQIGSPKGVARLMQRAGRSGHRPGAISSVVCVPTHVLELIEVAAVRDALSRNDIESRAPPRMALDVLSQHLVTLALGEGFEPNALFDEVRDTDAYSALDERSWQWTLDFIHRGGQALHGYPNFHKVVEVSGQFRVLNEQVAQRHRMQIGTISSDASLSVAYRNGKRLGTIEESFIARLQAGDVFQYAGVALELIRVRDSVAEVQRASRKSRLVPRWWGTHLPFSAELAHAMQRVLADWREGEHTTVELESIAPILQQQLQLSALPSPDEFLLERIRTHEGDSLFCYPFAGRLGNEGLAMVIASRLTRIAPMTLVLQANDYGLELQAVNTDLPDEATIARLFSPDGLLEDILLAINTTEIAKRRFRDIARIAGLVFDGFPGQRKRARQVQVSSGLVFEVLAKHDPENLLLDQARREVLEQQLELSRLKQVLTSIQSRRWRWMQPVQLTPLAFPLWAESLQSQTLSSEALQSRIEGMLAEVEMR